MTIPIISSTSNAQVKQLIQLQKKAKLRAEQDVFISSIRMHRRASIIRRESFLTEKKKI